MTRCAFCPNPLAGDDTDELVALIRGEPVKACFQCAVQVETGERLVAKEQQ